VKEMPKYLGLNFFDLVLNQLNDIQNNNNINNNNIKHNFNSFKLNNNSLQNDIRFNGSQEINQIFTSNEFNRNSDDFKSTENLNSNNVLVEEIIKIKDNVCDYNENDLLKSIETIVEIDEQKETTKESVEEMKVSTNCESKYFIKKEEKFENKTIGSQLTHNKNGFESQMTQNYSNKTDFESIGTQNRFTTTSQSIKRENNDLFSTNGSGIKTNDKNLSQKQISIERKFSEFIDSLKSSKRPLTPKTNAFNKESAYKKSKTGFSFEEQLTSFAALRQNSNKRNYSQTQDNSCKQMKSEANVIPNNLNLENMNFSNNYNWLKEGFSQSLKTDKSMNGFIIGKSSQLMNVLPQQTISSTIQHLPNTSTQKDNKNANNLFNLFSSHSNDQ
jgi:hypothetical protein